MTVRFPDDHSPSNRQGHDAVIAWIKTVYNCVIDDTPWFRLLLKEIHLLQKTITHNDMPMKMVYWGNKARGYLPAVIAAYGSLLLVRGISPRCRS